MQIQQSRKVTFSTIINILMIRKISLLISLIFTAIALYLVVTILQTRLPTQGVPSVDYNLVYNQGEPKTALVTGVEVKYDAPISGIYPTIISYSYHENNQQINSKYEVITSGKVSAFQVGKKLKIKVYKGQVIIPEWPPFVFPYYFFFLGPIILLTIESPFILPLLYNMNKILKLYKRGNVLGAKVSHVTQKRIKAISIITYKYTINEQKFIGKSKVLMSEMLDKNSIGQLIPIFVSVKNNKKSCVVPKSEASKNNWNIDF